MRRSLSQWFLGALAAPVLLFASAASAAPGPEACGNIQLTANAQCEFVTSGGCTAQCEPISFVAACDGKCNASISASCTADCSGSCSAECEVNPGSFDCQASCKADCSADCAGRCSAEDNKAECEGYCTASCDGSCKAQCDVVPPSADCQAQCQACCSGSCDVDANFDCSLDCSAELKGGCEVQCEAPEGALFCDGQYVDFGQNAEDCVAYLQEVLNIEVSGYAECSGNTCKAGCSLSACTTAAATQTPWDAGALAGAVVCVGMVVARRRRR